MLDGSEVLVAANYGVPSPNAVLPTADLKNLLFFYLYPVLPNTVLGSQLCSPSAVCNMCAHEREK